MYARKTGLLFINVGTPDAPEPADVKRYLNQFLSDPRVLDMNPVARRLLLSFVILPTRPKESAEAYQKIWTDAGSPLVVYAQQLVDRVQARLGDRISVAYAMRYQNPAIEAVLERFSNDGVDEVVVFPLFPQYSSAATGTGVQRVFDILGSQWNVPAVSVIPHYYDHPKFIDAFAAVARPALDAFQPDHILLSYHGLPERHCTKSDTTDGAHCLKPGCCDVIVKANRYCYRAHCYATSRLLQRTLGWQDDFYEVAFQSRLGKDPWIQPYTDARAAALPKEGCKRLAIMCPSFVADCLETIEEIGMRAAEDFKAAGGEELLLVPSLNASDGWVEAVLQIAADTSTSIHRAMNAAKTTAGS